LSNNLVNNFEGHLDGLEKNEKNEKMTRPPLRNKDSRPSSRACTPPWTILPHYHPSGGLFYLNSSEKKNFFFEFSRIFFFERKKKKRKKKEKMAGWSSS